GGEPMLAHRAMAQGEMVAEIVAGRKRAWDKRCIPAVCFTDPEIVTAADMPETARAAGVDVRVARTPFRANGRALTAGRDDGFVRIIARADTGLVLGLHAVGAGVAELAAAFATAIEMCATVDDLAETVFPHPTRGEALHEAAADLARHGLQPQA
ncbi:MAG: dihydrolipoyl dehydrogenase, partial [Alphaproteobacteria bacterium]